jgi:hypothetical protein
MILIIIIIIIIIILKILMHLKINLIKIIEKIYFIELL